MKAKAPEKIYLQENTTTDCYGEFWPEWFEARAKDSDIEYTSTDAFIEKACEWLKENITNNPNANSVLVRYGCVTLGMLVDDFKKYMEK